MSIPLPIVTVVPLETWVTLQEAPGVSEKQIISITNSGATTLPTPNGGVTFTSVYVDAPGGVQITMPAVTDSLLVGQQWLIKDVSGLAGTNTIQIFGNGYTLDNDTSFTIDLDYGSITFEWNGDNMSVVT